MQNTKKGVLTCRRKGSGPVASRSILLQQQTPTTKKEEDDDDRHLFFFAAVASPPPPTKQRWRLQVQPHGVVVQTLRGTFTLCRSHIPASSATAKRLCRTKVAPYAIVSSWWPVPGRAAPFTCTQSAMVSSVLAEGVRGFRFPRTCAALLNVKLNWLLQQRKL